MAVTINASTSSGLVQTADTSGVITLQNNGTDALSVSSGNLQFNSGYGSVATAYGCRAWVNFNGGGTIAIRASGNVTSITDNGVGLYAVNFTNAITDANYSAVGSGSAQGSTSSYTIVITTGSVTTTYGTHSTSSLGINAAVGSTGSNTDPETVQVVIFR